MLFIQCHDVSFRKQLVDDKICTFEEDQCPKSVLISTKSIELKTMVVYGFNGNLPGQNCNPLSCTDFISDRF